MLTFSYCRAVGVSDSYTTLRGPSAAVGADPAQDAPPRWVAYVVLAVPFLVTIAALRGLTVTLPIFHGSDERVYHVPTILRFASQLPFPDIGNYGAAQTPLFHLLLAYIGKLTGYELWRLRLIEALISYALALSVFELLYRRLALGYRAALALAVLFVLSPYVFGTSFRVMTDNLATLFVVLAIERLEAYRERRALGPFVVACACVGAAILTRQSAAFMLGVAGLYAVLVGAPARERVAGIGAVVLAAAPAGALFLVWHGLVPPGGDPRSCGLCSVAGGPSAGLQPATLELTLATIGLYGAVLFAPAWLRERPAGWPRGLAGAGAAVVLLLLWPARYGPHSAGLLWNAGHRLPAIDGTSLLFWVLVPLGVTVLWVRLRAAPRALLAVVFVGCFLVGTLAIRYPWQKYVDPFALLALMLTVRRDEFGDWHSLAGGGVLAVGFVAYALSFVV
jgi:4-amino-4-deoxy-L-arabinose transferase-like glycosyltransferase